MKPWWGDSDGDEFVQYGGRAVEPDAAFGYGAIVAVCCWILVVLLLSGCTTIKRVQVTDPNTGETLTVEGYTSGKDVEITTPSGWVVKASASTPTKAMFDGLAPVVGQAVGAAVANSAAGKPAAAVPVATVKP